MISIFIPIYNGIKYIARTIDSILSQSYSNFEIICIDDSSTDGSFELLQRYACQDSRIRLYRKPNEGCVPPSWNYAMPLFNGDFVLYMSQDDLLESNTIEALVKRQLETDADAVMPTEYAFFEDLPREQWTLYGKPELIDKIITGKDAFKLMIDYQIPGFALWRIDIIKRGGMRTETFNCDELAQRHWVSLCERVAFSTGVFLWRCDNLQSITKADSPMRYQVSYTHALLLELAEHVLAEDRAFLAELGNLYFFKLFKSMVLFRHKYKNYESEECRRVNYFHKKAYKILQKRNTLENWKYRVGRYNYFFMLLIVEFKYRQQKRRGVIELY